MFHKVCPREYGENGRLLVLVADDSRAGGVDEVAFAYGAEVDVARSTFEEIERAIEHLVSRSEGPIEVTVASTDEEWTADVRDLASQPPVVRYVNFIIREAYDLGASDIHLESIREGLRARFRVDGVLVTAPEPAAGLSHAIVSRIKLLAELNIAERRRPQDGRIRVRLEDREIDIRVSTVPNLFGESVVLRLLDPGGGPIELEELGMPVGIREGMERAAGQPHGMVLVTGPTGSGKTTTLYALLARRHREAEKIITVEDPVEYELPGVVQVPVHAHAGVGFGSALRSILRQDPDVLLIGEMRDPETAEIGVQAALTGHLVFSTLHTNDAAGAIPRLFDLGLPPFLVSATLHAVLAQRLIRRVCGRCAEEIGPDAQQVSAVAAFGFELSGSFRRGRGCPACRGTGYQGRTGIYELILLDDTLRAAIAREDRPNAFREALAATGVSSLAADGLARAGQGITTIEEVLRVVRN